MLDNINIDVSDAIRRVQADFKELSPERMARAVSMAINETLRSAKVDVKRQIKEEYKIPNQYLDSNRFMQLFKATANYQTGKLDVGGFPIPLIAFNPKFNPGSGPTIQSKFNRVRGQRGYTSVYTAAKAGAQSRFATGVTVNIKGQDKTIGSAFFAMMNSGKIGVFARGKYVGGRFMFRKNRIAPSGKNDLPINELTTLSVPIALLNSKVKNAVLNRMSTTFEERLFQKMRDQLYRMNNSK